MNGNPNYGHSRRGTRCVDLTRYDRHENFTVSIIVGLTGIKYVSIIEGSFNTAEFLKFIGEASNSYTDEGEEVFQRGDCLVVDNAPIHHNASERILRRYLPVYGVDYLFLPAYSPDLNPAEQCFRKVKTLIKSDRLIDLMHQCLKVAVFTAFSEISARDTRSFFQATEIINL